MGGRPPKIRGTNEKPAGYRKKDLQLLKDSTPIYQSQEFKPPETLTEAQLKVWEEIVDIFRNTYNCMVSDADAYIIELYCRARVACDEAENDLRKDPRAHIIVSLGVDKDGKEKTTAKPNPNLKKRKDNMELVLKYSDQLGLTPLARAKAGVRGANSKKDIDVFAELMQRSDD